MEVGHDSARGTLDIASVTPLDASSPSEHGTPVQITSPLIMRCWNREQVRQLCTEAPETVKILIPHPGLPGEPFVEINKALLSCLSPYYKAAFHSGFIESAQEIFDMELCAADMHAFRTWLRDGRLSFRWDKLSLEQLVRIYTFADYYDFPALRRTIMMTLVLDKDGDNAFRRLLTYKFEGYLSQLPPISPLYQWLGTVWARHIDGYAGSASSLAHRLESKMPEEFRDLVHSIRSNGRPPLTCRCCYHPCDYHEHSSEQEWEITCHAGQKGISKPDPSTYRKLSRRP